MEKAEKHKLILKILIGAAWADRHLEPEEVKFLEQILERYDLKGDRELISLLKLPVGIQTTETWVAEYFRITTQDERMQLLANIGKVLIADDHVSDIEHDFLDDYHELMAYIPAQPGSSPSPGPEVKTVRVEPQPPEGAGTGGFVAEAKKVVQHIGQFVQHALQKALNP